MSHLLTTKQAASRLFLAPETLEAWRHRGRGPEYVKLGRAVRYSEQSLSKFISRHTVRSTMKVDEDNRLASQVNDIDRHCIAEINRNFSRKAIDVEWESKKKCPAIDVIPVLLSTLAKLTGGLGLDRFDIWTSGEPDLAQHLIESIGAFGTAMAIASNIRALRLMLKSLGVTARYLQNRRKEPKSSQK